MNAAEKLEKKAVDKEKRLTAKRMLARGFSDNAIIDCTMIPLHVLRDLKKALKKFEK